MSLNIPFHGEFPIVRSFDVKGVMSEGDDVSVELPGAAGDGVLFVVSDSFVIIEGARPVTRKRKLLLQTASSFRSAVQKLEQHQPRIVVIDAGVVHGAVPQETARLLTAIGDAPMLIIFPTTEAMLRLPPALVKRANETLKKGAAAVRLPEVIDSLLGEYAPDAGVTALTARPAFFSVPDFDELAEEKAKAWADSEGGAALEAEGDEDEVFVVEWTEDPDVRAAAEEPIEVGDLDIEPLAEHEAVMADANDRRVEKSEVFRPVSPGESLLKPKVQRWAARTMVTGVTDRSLTESIWATETPESAIPRVLEVDEYQIERPLGQGRSADVYLGRWPETDEFVAIKVLKQSLAAEQKFVLRFRREIRAQAALAHPDIVRVKRYGRRKGTYYIAFELMMGTLRDALNDIGKLPSAIAIHAVYRTARALHYAHNRGVFHRAVKPSNIMVSPRGHMKLGDFSVAKSTIDPYESVHGARMGDPAYFSPEQSLGAELGPKTDIFSLGTVLTEMLTGQNIFARETFGDTILNVSRGLPVFAPRLFRGAHLGLSALAYRMLASNPLERISSAKAVASALEPAVEALDRIDAHMLKRFFEDPYTEGGKLRRDEANRARLRAKMLLSKNASHAPEAALLYVRAAALDGADVDSAAEAQDLCVRYGFDLDAPRSTDGRLDIEAARREGRLFDLVEAQLLALRKNELDESILVGLENLTGPMAALWRM